MITLAVTAVLSTQTIIVNGVVRDDLSTFNIGGHNFFKLRELGVTLDFDVEFDPSSNTAVVRSR